MKKRFTIQTFVAMLITVLSLASCNRDELQSEGDPDFSIIETDIRTFSNDATNDVNKLGEAEYVIRRARLYAFDGEVLDNMVYVDNITTGNLGELLMQIKVKQTTNKTLYIILNEPDVAAMHNKLALVNKPAAFDEIEYEMADYFTQEAYNNEDSFAKEEFCIPMFGTKTAVNTTTTTPTMPIPMSMRATRSLARVDILIQKNATPTYSVAFTSATKLTINNTRTKGYIAPTTLATGGLVNKVNAASGPVTDLEAPVRAATGLGNAVRAFTFYTPERDCTAEADKISFTLTDVKFGIDLESFDVVIGNDAGNVLTKIERNKVYKIYLTFLPLVPVEATLQIQDWDNVDVDAYINVADFASSNVSVNIPVLEGVSVSRSETIGLSALKEIEFLEYEYNGTKGNSSILPAGTTITGAEAFNGTTKSGNITITNAATAITSGAPIYMWFRTGNIKKCILVNFMEYTFNVVKPADYFYTGGSNNYTVDSYKKVNDKTIPVAWTAREFSTDGGTTWSARPTGIVPVFTEGGVGSETTESYAAEMTGTVGVNPHDAILKATPAIGGIYNLSNSTGASAIQNTANCYVINAPGSYSLPLVYGNAIKDGAANTTAYTYTGTLASGKTGTTYCVNHRAAAITDPYIFSNAGCVPHHAGVVWQDAKDLVTNIYISPDSRTLFFSVPAANICQGNAVIAVYNSANEALWSWHIWVTDYRLSETPKRVTNFQGYTYKFMPYDLGWCGFKTFPSRSIKVRFTQSETGLTRVVDMNQLENHEYTATYYQWGRNSAFPGSTVPMIDHSILFDPVKGLTSLGVFKTWYDANGREWVNTPPNISVSDVSPDGPSSYNGYRDPNQADYDKMKSYGVRRPSDLVDIPVYYFNSWNAIVDQEESGYNGVYWIPNVVIKTIYDPSPVGYHVPPLRAFSSLTVDGAEKIDGTGAGVYYSIADPDMMHFRYEKPGDDAVDFYGGGRLFSDGVQYLIVQYAGSKKVAYMNIQRHTCDNNSTFVEPCSMLISPDYGPRIVLSGYQFITTKFTGEVVRPVAD